MKCPEVVLASVFSMLQVTSLASCVTDHQNRSVVRISPDLLRSVLAGEGPQCDQCFTLLQDQTPVLQVWCSVFSLVKTPALCSVVLSQGCWSGDECGQECLLTPLGEGEAPSLKFCCCRGTLCNLHWREDTAEDRQRQAVREKLEVSISILNVSSSCVLVTAILLSLLSITLVLILSSYRRSQDKKILDNFQSYKICLIKL